MTNPQTGTSTDNKGRLKLIAREPVTVSQYQLDIAGETLCTVEEAFVRSNFILAVGKIQSGNSRDSAVNPDIRLSLLICGLLDCIL